MKKIFTLMYFSVILFLATTLTAQTTARATWQLIANQRATVTGNIDADSATAFGGLTARDYSGANLNGPLGSIQARWYISTNWPVNNTDIQNNNVHIDFTVSPKAGYNLKIDSLYAYVGGGGTSNMKANVYYCGTDTAFGQNVQLNTAGVLQLKQLSQLTALGRPGDDTLLVYGGLNVNVLNGQKFRFRIYPWYKASSASATRYIFTQNIQIKGTISAATSVKENTLPTDYSLEQNYPNPFNPSTRISFTLAKPGFTTLNVFNVLGQKIANLVSKELASGRHEYSFDASKLNSGIYFYRLDSGRFSEIKKMMLVK